MKKTAAIVAGCAILISGLFLLFNNSPDKDTLIPARSPTQTPARVEIAEEAPIELQVAEATEPVVDDFPITKEQLQDIEMEVEDIKNTAKEFEANR